MEKREWFVVPKENLPDRTIVNYLLQEGYSEEYKIEFLESGSRIKVLSLPEEKALQHVVNSKDIAKGVEYYYKKGQEHFVRPISRQDISDLFGWRIPFDRKTPGLFDEKAKRINDSIMLQKVSVIIEGAKSAGKKIIRLMRLKEHYEGEIQTLSELKGDDKRLYPQLKARFDVYIKKLKKYHYYYANISS